MGKFLSVFGAAALVVVGVLAVAFGIQAWNAHRLNVESKAFVDDAVPAITAHWDKQALLDKAAEGSRRGLATGTNAANFAAYSRLGALVEYGGATGEARQPSLFGNGPPPIASYKAKAKYENGEVVLHVFVTKHDGAWRIINLNVEGWNRMQAGQPSASATAAQ
jgi:hypothetical protein